ncbi:MAG: helix-turn-helix domain-containing protein [Planctomycetia bacterium]
MAWLRFSVHGEPSSPPLVVGMNGGCHVVSLTSRARHDVRWITRGKERHWTENVGTVHFLPSDRADHTFVTAMSADFVSRVLLLPRRHLRNVLESEHMNQRAEEHRLLAHDDPALQACVRQIFSAGPDGDALVEGVRDEAARRLVLRLAELCGGGRPDWHDDASVFDRRTLAGLVAHLDTHLAVAPCLSDMAVRTGLSPSHFAKKFRQTTGLSLHRFVNRRRMLKSLDLLRDESLPLAGVALELGFSSQSHFTRLFSSLTGMTPAKYQKQCRPTIG